MNLFLKLLFVFLISLLFDIVYAKYIIYTSRKNLLLSTIFSGLVILVSGTITLSYLDNKLSLIPAVLGGMCGTYICIRFMHKDE